MFKVNIDEINEELARFNAAINNFRPYTEGFMKNTAEKLRSFNSDYIDELEKLIDNMRDSKAPKLLKKADNLHNAAKKAMEQYEIVDEEISNKLSKEK